MKPRRQQPEQKFQASVKEYLDLALPKPGSWFGASAAIGTCKTTGGILKGMGYRAGTPDMLICQVGRPPIWLELKSACGVLSKAQEQCRKDLIAAGCYWELVRTLDDVERALKRFGVPLRATVGAVAG
jgi:hypothetical protein